MLMTCTCVKMFNLFYLWIQATCTGHKCENGNAAIAKYMDNEANNVDHKIAIIEENTFKINY